MSRQHHRTALRAGAARHLRFGGLFSLASALALFVSALCGSASATPFSQDYGSHMATDLWYMNVTESNNEGMAMFGSPSYAGNSIMFSPANFVAQVNGPGSIVVDSTIDTILMAKNGQVLNNITIDEAGDHTLSGLPGGAAIAGVGAAFFVTVLEVNYADASGLGLPILTQNMLVTTGAGPNGGQYSRPGDDGIAVIWDGSVFIDLDAFLGLHGVNGFVTKARLKWDNTLTAAADAVSSAFIKKKIVNGVIITTNIPEPATCLLALAGLVGCCVVRRRG